MPTSIPLFLAVFLLGFALGALLVAMQRRARVEELKRDFQAQLEAIVERTRSDLPITDSRIAVPEQSEKAHSDPSRAA